MNQGIPQSTPIVWMGSTKKDLKKCPPLVQQVIGFALYQAQLGYRHKDAKPLSGFNGASILEIVDRYDSNTYRAVYTVKFASAIYVLHVFQKKSKQGIKTPKQDIELIRKRLQEAELHYKESIGR